MPTAATAAHLAQAASFDPTPLTFSEPQGVRALGQAGATTKSSNTWNVPKLLAISAGATFALASAATNLSYAVSRADGLPQQVTWGAVAVAASVALAIAPAVVVQSLAQRKLGMASIAMSAVVLFGSYSVSAALGAATGGRMVNELEASDVASKRQAATASIAGAEKELAALSPSRLAIEVKSEITNAMSQRRDLGDCSGWLPHVNARAVCITVAGLRAELGRAERRVDLEERLRQARTTLASTKARGTVANSDALALQGFASAAGLHIGVDALNRLLVVLAVLVIELGAGLCFAVSSNLDGNEETERRSRRGRTSMTRTTSQVQPSPADPASKETMFTNPRVPAQSGVADHCPKSGTQPPAELVKIIARVPGAGHPGTPANAGDVAGSAKADVPVSHTWDTSPEKAVLAVLREKGGSVLMSQRAMAGMFGLSKSAVQRTLRDLQVAGVVKLVVSKRGTAVSLVGGAAAH